MQINQSTLAALFKGYRTLFLEAYQGAAPSWQEVALRTASASAQEIYHWLGSVPGMRELIGKVVIQNLSASNYAITNKEFESTVGVKQADIERDAYGIYSPLMSSMGIAAQQEQDLLVANLLVNGFATNDYTGTPFFANNKPHEPNNTKSKKFSNLLTTTLTPASYQTAKAMLKGLTNAQGRPMGLGRKLLLVVPPALEVAAQQILNADLIMQTAANTAGTPGTAVASAAVSNVNKGTASLLVWPQLAGNDTEWFLLEVGFPVRALIMQVEKEISFASLTDPEDDHVFLNHEFLYQAYGRFNAGYGMPQLAVGSNGTTPG
jgi:phage major head subunit gpT-like protein